MQQAACVETLWRGTTWEPFVSVSSISLGLYELTNNRFSRTLASGEVDYFPTARVPIDFRCQLLSLTTFHTTWLPSSLPEDWSYAGPDLNWRPCERESTSVGYLRRVKPLMEERKDCIRRFASGLQREKKAVSGYHHFNVMPVSKNVSVKIALAMFWHMHKYIVNLCYELINNKVTASSVGVLSTLSNVHFDNRKHSVNEHSGRKPSPNDNWYHFHTFRP